MGLIENGPEIYRDLSGAGQFCIDQRRDSGIHPVGSGSRKVIIDSLDIDLNVRSSRCLHLCRDFDPADTTNTFRRKCFRWRSPVVVDAAIVCVATCLAILTGIVVVCFTAPKPPSKWFCSVGIACMMKATAEYMRILFFGARRRNKELEGGFYSSFAQIDTRCWSKSVDCLRPFLCVV